MLIRLIVLPYTMFIFIFGYISVFIVMLFKKVHFIALLWSSFVGGFTFTTTWIFILAILSFLLSQEELERCFYLLESSDENSSSLLFDSSSSFREDESETLTMDEIYRSSSFDDDAKHNISDNVNNTAQYSSKDIIDHNFTIDHSQSYEEPKSMLNSDGTFDLTVNGKMVRSTPKEGAQAIKKVISND